MVARAAPTEVVAGRVVTHAVPSLTSSLLHQVRAVPAFHAVPATHVVHGAPADDTDAAEVVAARIVPQAFPPTLSLSPLNQVRAVPALTEVPAPNAVPTIRAIPTVDDSQIIIPNVAEGSFNIHPQYSFGYSISDSVTGDSKSRQESRDGDAVSGSYSVADPDGRIRTVTYTADDVHGFQATVTYDGEEGPVAIPFNAPTASLNTVEVPQPIAAAVQPVNNNDNVENNVVECKTEVEEKCEDETSGYTTNTKCSKR